MEHQPFLLCTANSFKIVAMTDALMMFWKYFAIKSQLVCFIRFVELGNYSDLL